MHKLLLFAFVVLGCLQLNASDVKYAVGTIPEKMVSNANTVKRMEEMEFEVISTTETILRKKYALTILSENGDKYAGFIDYYDKLRQITSIEGELFNARGELVKKLKNRDIKDISGVDNNTLYDDSRLKIYDFYCRDYPYTVEYTEEVKFNYSYIFPNWVPQSYEHLSVEGSSFTIVAPADYNIRFRAFNYNGQPTVITDKNKKKMIWRVANLQAIAKPFASPKWEELTTSILFAPSNFEVEGYKGDATSWASMGKFNLALNQGRDQLPPEIIEKVKQLTAGITDEKEKIKILYTFLQQNTRYISIQMGVGGWQPFDASYVAKKGYGDCKALSNYMVSLLKVAGIKGYYTLVHAGERVDDKSLVEDFPSHQFNHAIVCIPFSRDTMWLECTDQFLPAGYMSGFTGNRKALVINENGGVLISTPRYGINDNAQVRTIIGLIDAEGNLNLKSNTSYKALEQDEIYSILSGLSKEKVKKFLNKELDLSTYEINNFKYDVKKDWLPEVDEQLDITVTNYATISGKRIFFIPNVLNRSNQKISEEEERKVDYVFDRDNREVDSIIIEVPEGYRVEAAPKDYAVKTKFGSYSASFKMEGNRIIYHRSREQYSGRFPAKDGADLSEFYAEIYKYDHSRLVLVKKEG